MIHCHCVVLACVTRIRTNSLTIRRRHLTMINNSRVNLCILRNNSNTYTLCMAQRLFIIARCLCHIWIIDFAPTQVPVTLHARSIDSWWNIIRNASTMPMHRRTIHCCRFRCRLPYSVESVDIQWGHALKITVTTCKQCITMRREKTRTERVMWRETEKRWEMEGGRRRERKCL